MDFRPYLRPELVYLQKEADDPPALYDPLLHRRVNLGAVSRALVARLDGQRSVAALVDEVAAEHPDKPRATVEHTLRSLLLMNLVDGAGRDVLDRAMQLRTGRVPYEAIVLEEARFACRSSGECCQNYSFGPLGDDDVARIEALDPRRTYPHLGDRPYFETRERDGERERYLTADDDRCLFLLEDARCGLHAAFGPESKPGLCRLYPLTSIPTLDGLKIYDNGECATFAESARSGPSLASVAPAVRALLPADLDLHHPIVFLDGATPCDYGHYLRLQRALCDLAARPGPAAGGALVAVGRLARAFVDAVTTCPLAPGEPDATIDRLLARDAAAFTEPPPADRPAPEACAAIATIAGELLGASAPAIAHAVPSPRQLLSARLARQFAEVAHLVDALASHLADPEAVSLDPHHRALLALPVDAPEVDEVLRLSLRTQLFGHRALVDDRVRPAVLRLAFVHLVTVLGARVAASVRGPLLRRVTLADVSLGHMLAMRTLRQASALRVFVRHEAEAWAVIEAAPSLLAAAAALAA